MSSPKNTPRSLPASARKGRTNFTPRRSYARARASRERVDAISKIEKNQRSQRRFSTGMRIAINIICILGIIGLIVFTFFYTASPDTLNKSGTILKPMPPHVTK